MYMADSIRFLQMKCAIYFMLLLFIEFLFSHQLLFKKIEPEDMSLFDDRYVHND